MENKKINVINSNIFMNRPNDNISICRRCNKEFIRDKNVNLNSAYFYRCESCLSFPVYLHDIALSCVIQ